MGWVAIAIPALRGAGLRRAGLGLGLLLLVACNPQDAADAITRQAAASVATPLVENFMPPAQAAGVVSCLLDAATPAEIRSLAQHVGTTGSTVPLRLLVTVGTRPEAVQCLIASNLPHLPGAV